MVEPLSDPLNDRVITYIEPPPHRPLPSCQLFPNGLSSPPNFPLLKSHLKKEGRLSKLDAMQIMSQCANLLSKEKNLLEITGAVKIIGDLHGQLYDLLTILDVIGAIQQTKILFLGDYVDRGQHSIETLMVLYALKLNYPENVFLIRGNHECRELTSFFNFRQECLHKFDLEFYEAACESFEMLPIACLVNRKFLAVHGGLSPDLSTLDNLVKLNRFTEPPRQGLMCDILWSDPVDDEQGKISERFKTNEVRNCSYYFGYEAASNFLKRNKLLTLIRAHEVQLEGYRIYNWSKSTQFPTVITVFSAPNYCDCYNNKGAIVSLEDSDLNIHQLNNSARPYLLPNFSDLFEFSVPYVIEKILEILTTIIKAEDHKSGEEGTGEKVKELEEDMKKIRVTAMKKKIKAMSKMMIMFKTIRQEKDLIVELKGLCPDQKVPRGLIQQGRKALESAVNMFNNAKVWDKQNEKRP